MREVAEPSHEPAEPSLRTVLARTLVLGVFAGVLIGQLYLLATAIAFGFWSGYPAVAAIAMAWPVLTGRPWLPPGLSMPAGAGRG